LVIPFVIDPLPPACLIWYLRVSSADQDTEKNKAAILDFANERDFGQVEFIEETVSGIKDWKQRKIGKLIDELKEGDRIIVPEISRLSRTIYEIFTILETALRKKIYLYALKERWELNGSIQSAAMAMAFGLADATLAVLAALGIAHSPKKDKTPDKPEPEKPKADKPISGCALVMHLACENPTITKDEIRAELDKGNYTLKDSSIETALADTRKVLNHLIDIGKLKY